MNGVHADGLGVWQRRAQPLLGTLVEVGLRSTPTGAARAFDAVFRCVREVQECLSRFDADSDVGRFHGLGPGEHLVMRPATKAVLGAAAALRDATDGLFDITLGTSPRGWALDFDRLSKLDARTRLDLGGIGKGYAVDRAVEVLIDHGVEAGWVNAGGDLRAFGDADVPVWLRDESGGGIRLFASLQEGAFATSHFGPSSASRLVHAAAAGISSVCAGVTGVQPVHASVAAPNCLWADALTKVVACSGWTTHPVLARYDAAAWIH